MIDSISTKFNWRKLSPEDGEYFFGYYDRSPWNMEGTLHLAMKAPQCKRLPERGETAEIGLLDRQGNYSPVATTRAWCHQQGCMEQFLPRRPGTIIYNDYEEKEDRIVTRIFELGKGVVGRFEKPIYAISPDGRWGVSLDFARIPRRGYSYADAVLAQDRHPVNPDREGIWLVDLDTGAVKLIVSYRTMLERHPVAYGTLDKYIWLNHAIFNCDGSRVLWLFRQCTEPERVAACGWQTFMYTAGLDGSDAECILPEVYWHRRISHQIWGRTPREILVDANWSNAGHEVVVLDESRRPFLAGRLAPSHGEMSHMVFSPDGKRLFADSYPGKEKVQSLLLIDAATGKMEELGRFRHSQPEGTIVDVRCDLHPRWGRDGKSVTVDSIHDGRRAIYMLDLE